MIQQLALYQCSIFNKAVMAGRWVQSVRVGRQVNSQVKKYMVRAHGNVYYELVNSSGLQVLCCSVALTPQLHAQFFNNLLCDAAVGKLQITLESARDEKKMRNYPQSCFLDFPVFVRVATTAAVGSASSFVQHPQYLSPSRSLSSDYMAPPPERSEHQPHEIISSKILVSPHLLLPQP